MLAYYGTDISPNKTETAEGYLICRNVPIARTGSQQYQAKDLRLDGDPERPVVVDRHPEDVFEEATLASFEGKPVTDGHPPENLGPENYAAYAKGHVQNVRREGDYIVADLYINDANLASEIQNGVKREVSCGYLCNFMPDKLGYRQTKIRGNHVAVVPKGRAGSTVAIKDTASQAEKGRNTLMNYWKTFLAAFAGAAKDAKPEELDGLVTTTADALDAAPAEKAPEAEPAKEAPAKETEDEMVERAPKGDDLGSKLDLIIEMLRAKSRGGRGERMHDETDIDEAISRLSGEEDGKALTIPVENDCASGPARDAAVELLKKVRPAVASIQDKNTRAKVTDALLSAIQGEDMMGKIARSAQDSAKANIQNKNTYEQLCAASESAYAARNPHTKKEG